jgi:predicted secreted protein
MPTKSVKYGRLLTLRFALSGTPVQVDNLTTTAYNQSRDTRETTSKDSADNEESVGTIRRRTIPFTAFASEASTTGGFVYLQNAFDSDTFLSWKVGSGEAGAHFWSGSATLVKLDFSAPHDGNVECSGELKVTGAVTFGTD